MDLPGGTDCGWTDGTSGSATISHQATAQGRSDVWKFDVGVTAGSDANLTQDVGSFATRTVFEFDVYFDTDSLVDTSSGGEALYFAIWKDSDTLLKGWITSRGIYIKNSAGGSDLISNSDVSEGSWHTFIFDVDWDGTNSTVDICIDGKEITTGQDCGVTGSGGADGLVQWRWSSSAVADKVMYLSKFDLGDSCS